MNGGPDTLMAGLLSRMTSPRLLLARASALFDPLRALSNEQHDDLYWRLDDPEDRWAHLYNALMYARDHLPGVYSRMVQAIRANRPYYVVEKVFLEAFAEKYPHIEIDSLSQLADPMPIPELFEGVGLFDPDGGYLYPESIVNFLERYFGLIPPGQEPMAMDIEAVHECMTLAVQAASSIARTRKGQPALSCVGLHLMWMFSRTNNTLLDYTYYEFCEAGFEPLDWSANDLEMINEGAEEAEYVLQAVAVSERLLRESPVLSDALDANLQKLRDSGDLADASAALRWPSLSGAKVDLEDADYVCELLKEMVRDAAA